MVKNPFHQHTQAKKAAITIILISAEPFLKHIFTAVSMLIVFFSSSCVCSDDIDNCCTDVKSLTAATP